MPCDHHQQWLTKLHAHKTLTAHIHTHLHSSSVKISQTWEYVLKIPTRIITIEWTLNPRRGQWCARMNFSRRQYQICKKLTTQIFTLWLQGVQFPSAASHWLPLGQYVTVQIGADLRRKSINVILRSCEAIQQHGSLLITSSGTMVGCASSICTEDQLPVRGGGLGWGGQFVWQCSREREKLHGWCKPRRRPTWL